MLHVQHTSAAYWYSTSLTTIHGIIIPLLFLSITRLAILHVQHTSTAYWYSTSLMTIHGIIIPLLFLSITRLAILHVTYLYSILIQYISYNYPWYNHTSTVLIYYWLAILHVQHTSTAYRYSTSLTTIHGIIIPLLFLSITRLYLTCST